MYKACLNLIMNAICTLNLGKQHILTFISIYHKIFNFWQVITQLGGFLFTFCFCMRKFWNTTTMYFVHYEFAKIPNKVRIPGTLCSSCIAQCVKLLYYTAANAMAAKEHWLFFCELWGRRLGKKKFFMPYVTFKVIM